MTGGDAKGEQAEEKSVFDLTAQKGRRKGANYFLLQPKPGPDDCFDASSHTFPTQCRGDDDDDDDWPSSATTARLGTQVTPYSLHRTPVTGMSLCLHRTEDPAEQTPAGTPAPGGSPAACRSARGDAGLAFAGTVGKSAPLQKAPCCSHGSAAHTGSFPSVGSPEQVIYRPPTP